MPQVVESSDTALDAEQNGGEDEDLFGSGGEAQGADDLFGATGTTNLGFTREPISQNPQQPQPAKQRVEDMDLDAAGVPQGWVDAQGGWNWYSAEERLDVARGMFGEMQYDTPNQSDGK